MKSRICPYRRHCHDAGSCETCDFEKAFARLVNKNKRAQAEIAKLKEENEKLKEKIEILKNPNF